jgi:Ubiquitin-like autophagy protein Apg12
MCLNRLLRLSSKWVAHVPQNLSTSPKTEPVVFFSVDALLRETHASQRYDAKHTVSERCHILRLFDNETSYTHMFLWCCFLCSCAVKVHFTAVSNAPILRQTKFKVPGSWTMYELQASLRTQLNLSASTPLVGLAICDSKTKGLRSVSLLIEHLILTRAPFALAYIQYLYCNRAFEPSQDQMLAELFLCFGIGDELLMSYSTTEAWA